MLKHMLCGAMLLSLASPALATNWVYVATGDRNVEVSLDKDSIGPGAGEYAGMTAAWFKQDHSKDNTTPVRTSKRLYVFDCAGKQMMWHSFIDYAPNGNMMNDGDGTKSMAPVAPDTVGAAMFQSVCGT